jgi:UDP-N-acetylglucosamine diphosphorylase/glucosamine-1-phosphate N-acetyltransferase
MHLCHFEERPEAFEPICLTRPVFELRCGLTTLAQKQRRYFTAMSWSAWMRPALEEVYRVENPGIAVNEACDSRDTVVVLVNGRWLPPAEVFEMPPRSSVGLVGEEVAYVLLRGDDARFASVDEVMRRVLPRGPAGGRMLSYLWDVVERNADEIRRDYYSPRPSGGEGVRGQVAPCDAVERTTPIVAGPAALLRIAPSAKIEPMVLADTTHGPIVIDDGAFVTAFTRLEGPCHIGAHSQVVGAKIRAGTSIGPQCRVGGEVEASILHGYSNKYHEGFLGHAYVGSWVNLGAGTHNSDLRNDYGEVSVVVDGHLVRTGMTKVGCFLGDHTKTALGTLINTGTNVGAFCNLLPAGRFPPKHIPSYASWINGSLRQFFTLDQMLATAQTVMSRRGIDLTDAHRTFYTSLHAATEPDRRRLLRAEEPRLRKAS